MRAPPPPLPALALLVLLAPLHAAAADAPVLETHDLVVQLHDGMAMADLPPGAVPVQVVHAFVVPDAGPRLEAWLRAHHCVLSVTRAEPLAPASDPNLRLTRADPPPAATGAGTPYAGRGVTVAVVDSGIDATHPDLAGRVKTNVKLVEGKFLDAPGDADGHGTHVAGLVAASGASSGGKWRGVAPEAELVGLDISGRFTTASALLAYDWLFVHRERLGIDVVVNAWGRVGREAFDPHDANVRAIDRLVDAGVVVLFSASNHGPGPSTLSLEAMDPKVVTVGAVDAAAQLMPYSSRGPVLAPAGDVAWVKPDVVAPGDAVVGLRSLQSPPRDDDPDALHRVLSGTSQAVPHVAGVVALMLEANPALTPAAVQNALRESAVDLAGPGPDDATGFGLVDAVDAVRRARGLPADRGNVLVAGGVDRHEDEARLDAPEPRAGLLALPTAPTAEWTTTFPVKAGARALAFELAWGAPGSLVVTLERSGAPEGSWTEAQPDGAGAVVRGRLDAPEPGMWTLRARGAAPIALDVASRIDVLLPSNATRALELDSRYRLPDTPASAFTKAIQGDAQALVIQAKLFAKAHPAAAPAFAAGVLLAVALVRGPRRPRIERVVVLEPLTPQEPSGGPPP